MRQLTTEEQQIIYLIKTDPDQARYFFARAKSLKWFNIWKEQGYFNPENITYDANGYAEFWIVLDYLERVSEQVQHNTSYGKELIDLIGNVVQFSKNIKQINNYYIWWYCVKITNNLPISIIKNNLPIYDQKETDKIKYGFRTWLIEWADTTVQSASSVSDITKNLLPKFLADDTTIKYAETIIDVITRIRISKKQAGASYDRENVLLKWDSYWILQAFNKQKTIIGQKCSNEIMLLIADRLKKSFEYKQKEHYVNIDIGKNTYQIKVLRIEADDLGDEEINYKEDQYLCSVRKFSQEQLEKADRANDFWALHSIHPIIEIKQFPFDAQNKESFISAIKDNMPGSIDLALSADIKKKLGQLFDGLYSDYSEVWLKSIASGNYRNTDSAGKVLTIILRDILIAKCETNRKQGRMILETLLGEKYRFPIFKRLVLLCTDKFWPDYSMLLERFFDIVPDALDDNDYEVELYDLLNNHNQEFNTNIIAKLKTLIDQIPIYYVEKGEKLSAYWQYKWFSPLRNNPEFAQLYEISKQKAEPKDEKPYEPERSAIKSGFVAHKSPISKEDILQKPIAELIKYLNNFKGADFWNGAFEGEPDKDGLADVLQASVKEEPSKFTNELDEFLHVNYFYLHRVFRGIKEAWNDNKEINWENIFKFSLQYFARDSIVIEALEAQGQDNGNGKYIWIVEDIVDLIADGCKNNERAFEQKYFNSVEKIFNLVLPLLKGEKNPDTQRDGLTYALNTTLGRVIMSYISFSWRIVRATGNKELTWGQNKYDRFFTIGIEADIWFGCYLLQMNDLDENYTKYKIESYSVKSVDDYTWQMFMEGYLSRAQLNKKLYSLMRTNYVKALENINFDEQIDERLVQHITVGYLHDKEVLADKNSDGKDSLFWKMLSEASSLGKVDRWLEVISFFWSLTRRTIRKEEQDSQTDLQKDEEKRILQFWEWTYNKRDYVKEALGESYHSFLGQLAELAILLDNIDEVNENWLKLCAPHIDQHHNSTFFIEYLTKFQEDESIKRIGKIFLKSLENTTPTFRSEDIQLIVKRLYSLGKTNPDIKKDADEICNTYGRRGVHFLKKLHDENQQKS